VGVFADQQYTTEFLDSEMEDSIDFWKIRGASIAFFDQVNTYGRRFDVNNEE
jgi:hypothetical protein